MKKYFLLLCLLLLPATAWTQDEGYFVRPDCGDLAPVTGTVCSQTTTSGGRTPGLYFYNGTAWTSASGVVTGPFTPTSLTNHGVIIGQGSSAVVATAVGTTGQCFLGVSGGDPVWGSCAATSGTVTSFSAGDGAPFFTTTEANITTTPALTFNVTAQTGNCVFASPSGGGSGAPACRSLVFADMPSAVNLFSAITSATNTTAAMVVGTGASLAVSGSGTIAATTAAALAANGANCSAGSAPLGVSTTGAAESCTDYLEEPATTGVVVKTAANTSVSRDITGTGGNIVITNGSPAGFAGDININTGASVPAVTPTDDTILVGNGAAWASVTLPNCIDSGGQHLNYTTATNSVSCGTAGGGTISGLTTSIIPVAASATSITNSTTPQLKTNSGVLEIGSVGTNSWDLDTSAVTGHKSIVVQNLAGTLPVQTGALVDGNCLKVNAGLQIIDAGAPCAAGSVKADWDAGGITTDGTLCADPTYQVLNSGPRRPAFSCADNNGSIFYGSMILPAAINTATFTLVLYHAASEVITFAGDFSAMCRNDGDVINNTFGTAQSADVALAAVANQTQQQTSAAVTPNGTCSAGALLIWRYVVDAANFSANAANSKVLHVFMAQAS